jgi:hypothetical protein
MQRTLLCAVASMVAVIWAAASGGAQPSPTYTMTAETIQGIGAAAPAAPLVKPMQPLFRKGLFRMVGCQTSPSRTRPA